ncbi:MAG: TIGR04255 family protein [bacterium]|nr:TIGR04255 family protein [bacterium]
MAIDEVFNNPTVKQVIFQIKYPNLLFLDKIIGDFQKLVMDKLPESSEMVQMPVMFADSGGNIQLRTVQDEQRDISGKKIWQFQTLNKDITLSVTGNSIDVVSLRHKTYNNDGADEKFRDVIQFVVDAFLNLTQIPKINRIGIRYIDECPLPQKDNETFESHYNTTFPLRRFDLTQAHEMTFAALVKKGDYFLRYIEKLPRDSDSILVLDFDGFAQDIPAVDYLRVTDELHTLISNEYESTIKEPVYEFMRKEEV